MSSSSSSSLLHRFSESASDTASIAGSEIAPVAGDGSEEVVEEEKLYVAVGRKVSESKSTLLWALQKNSSGKGIVLLHVNQPSQTISVYGSISLGYISFENRNVVRDRTPRRLRRRLGRESCRESVLTLQLPPQEGETAGSRSHRRRCIPLLFPFLSRSGGSCAGDGDEVPATVSTESGR